MSGKRFRLAEAYVIPQEYRELFDIRKGLRKGTIFKELYRELPWMREGEEDDRE